jgi:hypothetical protein
LYSDHKTSSNKISVIGERGEKMETTSGTQRLTGSTAQAKYRKSYLVSLPKDTNPPQRKLRTLACPIYSRRDIGDTKAPHPKGFLFSMSS